MSFIECCSGALISVQTHIYSGNFTAKDKSLLKQIFEGTASNPARNIINSVCGEDREILLSLRDRVTSENPKSTDIQKVFNVLLRHCSAEFISKILELDKWESGGDVAKAKDIIIRCFQYREEELELCGLKLTSLPKSFIHFNFLRSFNCSFNNFESLPIETTELVHLKELDCSNNKILSFSGIENLINLKELRCSRNKITTFPEEFIQLSNLEIFDCSQNQIKLIPPEIARLNRLVIFSCSNNQLESLPAEIGDLYDLEELHCSGNQIQTLPFRIGLLKHLKILKCNSRESSESLLWLVEFLKSCAAHQISQEQLAFLTTHCFIEAVFDYRDPLMRHVLGKEMLRLVKDKVAQEYIKKNLNGAQLPRHGKLPLIFISLLCGQRISMEICDAHLAKVCSRTFKDAKHLKVYMGFLQLLLQTNELSLLEKEFLLKKVLAEASLVLSMRTIGAIANLGQISELVEKNLNDLTFSTILLSSFQKIVPVKPSENFTENFLKKFFDDARIPNYISIYAAKIATIKGPEREKLLNHLALCVEGFLNGTFKEMRYAITDIPKMIQESVLSCVKAPGVEIPASGSYVPNIDPLAGTQPRGFDAAQDQFLNHFRYTNLHLQTVFSGRSDCFDEWKRGESHDLSSYLFECDSEKQAINFHTIFVQKILKEEYLDPMLVPFLCRYLRSPTEPRKILEDMDAALQTAEPGSELYYLLSVQKKCFELMADCLKISDKITLLIGILEDLKRVQGTDPFTMTIENYLEVLKAPIQTKGKFDAYTIVDTDDFEDLFLSGTEVGGSCFAIDGDPDRIQCLLAVVGDGKTRMLGIKDEKGKLIARHAFRVLLDGPEPVLFIDSLLPSLALSEFRDALVFLAKQRAKKLGFKLLSRGVGFGSELRSLVSLGTNAPVDHSDDADGPYLNDGKYQISGAHVIK